MTIGIDGCKGGWIAANLKALNKSLAAQTRAIIPKMRELDEFLNLHKEYKNVIRESHPEVCLYRLNGKVVMSKKSEQDGLQERGIKYQFIDMKEKGMSKGEFTSVAQANGGIENMVNWEGKDKDMLALIKYIADEDKLEKILGNPQIIKTPVVRNGKQSTLGYQPEIWKGWS